MYFHFVNIFGRLVKEPRGKFPVFPGTQRMWGTLCSNISGFSGNQSRMVCFPVFPGSQVLRMVRFVVFPGSQITKSCDFPIFPGSQVSNPRRFPYLSIFQAPKSIFDQVYIMLY